ncbi:ATP-dependent DNA helicase, partial [Enterococcus lactis]
SRLITLNRSYRSTYPITNFAKSLLPNGDEIEAFNRPGKSPEIFIRHNEKECIDALIECAKQELKDEGTVAIVTKNLNEAKQLHQHTYNQLNPT